MRLKTRLVIMCIALFSVKGFTGSSIFSLGPRSLGEINYPYTVSAIGRGGVEMAIVDSLTLNTTNFAMWTSIPRTIITLNLLKYQRLNTDVTVGGVNSVDATFNGGYLAFPLVHDKLVFGIGLTPLSRNESSIQVSPGGNGTNAKEFLLNKGNISEANLVLSYAFTESFSLAAAVNYQFGRLEDTYSVEYSTDGFGDIMVKNDYRFYGAGFAVHGFYGINDRLNAGLKIKFPSSHTLVTRQESLNTLNQPKEFRDVEMPMELGAGIGYQLSEQWIGGLDFNFQNWESGYKIENQNFNNFTNSFRLGVGIEKTPLNRRFIPWSQKLNLRAGIFAGKFNRLSNGEAVYEYGIGLGLGMPILNIRNRLDFAFELGFRGSNDTNLASENYYRLHISISASELWFVREEE